MHPFCYLCFVSVMLSCLFIATVWLPAAKKGEPLGSFICDVFLCFCHFPRWCPGCSTLFPAGDHKVARNRQYSITKANTKHK